MPILTKTIGGLAEEIIGKGISEASQKGLSASGRRISKQVIDTILSSKGKSVLGESKNASKLFAGEGMGIPTKDLHAIKYLAETGDTRLGDYKAAYDEGMTPVMINIADEVNTEIAEKSQLAQLEKIRNTTTGISEADKQVADELAGSPEGVKWLQERAAEDVKLKADKARYEERRKLGYQVDSDNPSKAQFKKKSRYEKAVADKNREIRDNTSTANPKFIEDELDDSLRAQPGYGKEAGPRNPQRDPKKGFKPSNKDLETGITYQEYLEQHHLLFNAEGSALFQQQIFKQDPGLIIAMQRYVAKQYDSAFGEAAQNMANLPASQVHSPYHKWLRELKLDGVSGKHYEQFWKQKLLENENMTAQQIQDAVDEWFEEIIYPSIIVLDDYLSKADLSKVNVKDISFPKNLLKQARASIENELNPVKPTIPRGKGTTTAHDVQMDDIHTRAERGEFGPGRRSWFKESKARDRAKEIVQQGD